MSAIDRSAQFDKIADKARSASAKLKAAGNRARDRLQTDVGHARDRATAAAGQLNDKSVGARSKAALQWHELRTKWQAQVAKGKADGQDRHERLDADLAANHGEPAEE
jgi:hypothetical protein